MHNVASTNPSRLTTSHCGPSSGCVMIFGISRDHISRLAVRLPWNVPYNKWWLTKERYSLQLISWWQQFLQEPKLVAPSYFIIRKGRYDIRDLSRSFVFAMSQLAVHLPWNVPYNERWFVKERPSLQLISGWSTCKEHDKSSWALPNQYKATLYTIKVYVSGWIPVLIVDLKWHNFCFCITSQTTLRLTRYF